MSEKHFKYTLIFVFLIFTNTLFCFSNIFNGQVLYETGPFFRFGLKYSDLNDIQTEIKSGLRIKYDTLFDYKVKDPLIAGLVKKESSFVIHSISVSNALGVYQMKPFFADENGISNPFYPFAEEKIDKILDSYRSKLGTVENSLAAYHVGFYGVKNDMKNSLNPLSRKGVSDYVNKIMDFRRQYNVGDIENLYDYLWIVAGMDSFDSQNRASVSLTIPQLWFGSMNLNLNFDERVNASVSNEFFINSFLQLFLGFDNGIVGGVCLRSSDWNCFANIEFDTVTLGLKWFFKQIIDDFFYSVAFSNCDAELMLGYRSGIFNFSLGMNYNGQLNPFLTMGCKY